MRAIRFAFGLALTGFCTFASAQWEPVQGRIMTRWAAEVSSDAPLPEYPRPQLRRDEWLNLNGLWEYAIVDRDAPQPEQWDGKILVPFAAESALSGVGKAVTPDDALWYRTEFRIPAGWDGRRVLLHFGAVDWDARVWLNGRELGGHRGGYTPFSLDLTEWLVEGEQELVVRVWDPTDTGTQGRGKQVLEPRGIWYTAVTGIWQTVWIEPVSATSIRSLTVTPDIDAETATFDAVLSRRAAGAKIAVSVRDGGREVAFAEGPADEPLRVRIPDPKLWSPDSPHLYDATVRLVDGGRDLDQAETYLGMRKISTIRDRDGRLRLALNNEILFQIGPLDQGWWPDGLYTAPTDEALRFDVQATRDLGFNVARKHVKVEPARWYYHCDQLGLMVWQDMPSAYLGGRDERSLFVGPWAAEDAPRDGVSAAQWEQEWREIIDSFRTFPSIVMWVPFNEGWGQYDTARIAEWTKAYDPTRLVNAASGWTDRGVGDIYDTHMYPGPGMQTGGPDRVAILGEFGGLGWPVEDHLWWNKRNWGYRTYYSRQELNDRYDEVVSAVLGPYSRGTAAAIYTQTTDVEGEVNGLMTYDRALVKLDADRLKRVHAPFFRDPPSVGIIMPTSITEPQQWSYSFENPGEGWAMPETSTEDWTTGAAPFRSSPDLDFPNGAEWTGDSIWIRREFDLREIPSTLWLEAWHSVSEGEIYINGRRAAELVGATRREYRHQDLTAQVGLLKKGKNTIAVHATVGDPDRESRRDLDIGLYAIR